MPAKAGRPKPKPKRQDAQGRLRVKQVRSGIGRPAVHRRTLLSLGLRHHQAVVEVSDSPASRGMLFQVRHLVEVTPVEGR